MTCYPHRNTETFHEMQASVGILLVLLVLYPIAVCLFGNCGLETARLST